jgi:glycosyltransferase involved in cell wall biosynthesis
VLFTEHGRFYPDYPSIKRTIFNRLVPSRRDRFVAVGQSVRQALVANEGLSPDRIEVVYNGIDTAALSPNADLRCEVRRELGLGDEFAVMQVARLDTIKDHSTAVRAIEVAARQRPDIRLFIIGDGPERSSIESLVADLGLQNRVTLLGTRSDVHRLLAAADGFLLTSVSEGIPVTIIEAMAAGVPVVSTSVGGIPEILEHETTGLLAHSGDVPSLAENLVRLANDRTLRRRILSAAKVRADAQFSERQMLDAYCQMYDSMAGARKG